MSTRTSSARAHPAAANAASAAPGGPGSCAFGGQVPGGVPAGHRGDGVGERPRGVADDEGGVGPPAEAAAGAEQPVAEALLLEAAPGAGGELLEAAHVLRVRAGHAVLWSRAGPRPSLHRVSATGRAPFPAVRPREGDTNSADRPSPRSPAPSLGRNHRDLRHHTGLRRRPRQGVHRRVSGGLHLRGRPDALHPPRRVRRLRCLRAGLPGRGHLLRGRRPGQSEGLVSTANVEFFSDLGGPAGSAQPRAGKVGKDHPLVAALPPGRPKSSDRHLWSCRPQGVRRVLPDSPWDALARELAQRAARSPRTASSTSCIQIPVHELTPALLAERWPAPATRRATPTALGTSALRTRGRPVALGRGPARRDLPSRLAPVRP